MVMLEIMSSCWKSWPLRIGENNWKTPRNSTDPTQDRRFFQTELLVFSYLKCQIMNVSGYAWPPGRHVHSCTIPVCAGVPTITVYQDHYTYDNSCDRPLLLCFAHILAVFMYSYLFLTSVTYYQVLSVDLVCGSQYLFPFQLEGELLQ